MHGLSGSTWTIDFKGLVVCAVQYKPVKKHESGNWRPRHLLLALIIHFYSRQPPSVVHYSKHQMLAGKRAFLVLSLVSQTLTAILAHFLEANVKACVRKCHTL